jgi:hypothetical protein
MPSSTADPNSPLPVPMSFHGWEPLPVPALQSKEMGEAEGGSSTAVGHSYLKSGMWLTFRFSFLFSCLSHDLPPSSDLPVPLPQATSSCVPIPFLSSFRNQHNSTAPETYPSSYSSLLFTPVHLCSPCLPLLCDNLALCSSLHLRHPGPPLSSSLLLPVLTSPSLPPFHSVSSPTTTSPSPVSMSSLALLFLFHLILSMSVISTGSTVRRCGAW